GCLKNLTEHICKNTQKGDSRPARNCLLIFYPFYIFPEFSLLNRSFFRKSFCRFFRRFFHRFFCRFLHQSFPLCDHPREKVQEQACCHHSCRHIRRRFREKGRLGREKSRQKQKASQINHFPEGRAKERQPDLSQGRRLIHQGILHRKRKDRKSVV